jgi:DNA ligase 1
LDNQSLKTIYNKYGDAGDVAFEAKKRQSFTLRKPKPLSIKSVYQSLVKIANAKGTGSQEVKQRIVERLLQDARGGEESRYIVRTLVQHVILQLSPTPLSLTKFNQLRIGAVKTTMLIALSRAFLLSRPPGGQYPIRAQLELASLPKDVLAEVFARAEETVKACFARHPDYNDLIPCLLEVGVSDELLLRCGLKLHIPLRPMLGSITRDLSEMLTKLQGRGFTCEYKYDGQRAQVHCDDGGKVSIFSRHLELMTDKYPDLVALVPRIRGEGVGSFIMEGEVVAIDRESGNLKSFQTLAGRGRKDVLIGSVKVDVCLFAFDLMYLNGEELLNRPFRERRELLRSLFVEIPGRFTRVKSIDASSADSEAVLEFFKSATDFKCEGIMVKVLDNVADSPSEPTTEASDDLQLQHPPLTTSKKNGKSKTSTDKEKDKDKGTRRKALLATYEPDKRLDSWLKVKKDYHTAADTLDLIPIAGWHGQGRKAKWWSPVLLAVRNPDTGRLEAVCKAISGFTDKFYADIKAKYAEASDNVISRPAYIEYQGPEPSVWFEPQEVWEMGFGDITLSPVYTAALGFVSQERGLSLRFPRFLRKRDDKGIDEASTADFLAALFRKQEGKRGDSGEVDVDAAGGNGAGEESGDEDDGD